MTREEAIEYNKNLREYMRITDKASEYKFLKENYEALDMAIKELEQEPCEDCVSRKEVFETFGGELLGMWGRKALMEVPHVKPQPKTGHWIYKSMKGQFCSECDEPCVWKFNYCPNCGAKMVEVEK